MFADGFFQTIIQIRMWVQGGPAFLFLGLATRNRHVHNLDARSYYEAIQIENSTCSVVLRHARKLSRRFCFRLRKPLASKPTSIKSVLALYGCLPT